MRETQGLAAMWKCIADLARTVSMQSLRLLNTITLHQTRKEYCDRLGKKALLYDGLLTCHFTDCLGSFREAEVFSNNRNDLPQVGVRVAQRHCTRHTNPTQSKANYFFVCMQQQEYHNMGPN